MDFLDDLFSGDPNLGVVPEKASFPVKVKTIPASGIDRTANNHPPVVNIAVEQCLCGHPQDAHEDGDGNCQILECDCISWCPPSHDQNSDAAASEEVLPQDQASPQLCVCGHNLDEHSDEDSTCQVLLDEKSTKKCPCNCWRLPTLQLQSLPAPNHDEPMPAGYCQHLCENDDCQKWWTHGEKHNCAFPDILKQGLCQDCSTNKETFQLKIEDDFKDGKLTSAAQIKVRNDEAFICKDMTIEQLTNHIFYYAKQIEEMRVRALHARKMRSDLEEEELANIPEVDREAFIQALRRGQKKGEKKPRAAKKVKDPTLLTPKAKETALRRELETKGKSSEEAKALATIMVKTGKSLEWAEAFLND